MNAVEIPAGQIEWDGKTVWVTSWNGNTIGRFGRGGVDVHTASGDGCLDCVAGLEPVAAWEWFTASMFEHHHVVLVPECRPAWCHP